MSLLAGALANLLPRLVFRVNGLGLLQGYLVEGEADELRVHVWHPSLVDQRVLVCGGVHDHRFDLESTVVVGEIADERFDAHPDPHGGHQMVEFVNARAAKSSHQIPVERLPDRYRLERRHLTTYRAGDVYRVPFGQFHRTTASSLCVTVCRKRAQRPTRARAVVPVGAPLAHSLVPGDVGLVRGILSDARTALLDLWRNS